ncbi:response regulator transcription factor [Salirhabdus sp. Marseille-P4669]|uniref:response regulator transcription factor n=1 Tax=Salirhabdus sp. Marseille-P4669 TaxID=2042310 RepID=UPI000C79CB6A|nr:response regulator transcription factor [Salirhabdus sp. Marseille-P4669]
MEVTIVKEPSLLRDALIMTLKEIYPDNQYNLMDPLALEELDQQDQIADLIILDVDFGIDFTQLIHRYKNANKKVIIWTTNLTSDNLVHYFKLYLDGYFYNGMQKEELISAIQKILRGGIYIHHELSPILLNDYASFKIGVTNKPIHLLSKREWDVLELLTKGFRNEEIANQLFISEKTVKNHVSSILDKLHVQDRTNAVIMALKKKWFIAE